MLVWLVACADPRIEGVSPMEIPAGDTVTVRGQDLVGACAASLVDDDGGDPVPLDARTAEGAPPDAPCTLRIPRDLRPGRYLVTVRVGEVERALPDGLIVGRPREEEACTGRFTSNTQVSLARGEVAIERFFPDGYRDTVRVAVLDVERVEYEAREACTAVFLRQRDQARVLYQDGAESLEDRAKTLARTIERPLVRVEQPTP